MNLVLSTTIAVVAIRKSQCSNIFDTGFSTYKLHSQKATRQTSACERTSLRAQTLNRMCLFGIGHEDERTKAREKSNRKMEAHEHRFRPGGITKCL